jgi:predicted protein tyrosine phosphatase
VKKAAMVVSRVAAGEITPMSGACHILIQDPSYGYTDGLPKSGWHDSIVIRCHDIIRPTDGYVHFTPDMAVELVGFIRRNEGRPMLVSCDAGLSRSVAVGSILKDCFGYGVRYDCGTDEHRSVLIRAEVMRILREQT